ncbi:Type I phosphodiesterase / nucleotide pyrophosphatase family protein [Candida albicans]|nr:Type I phosphodiesterase / nucleotide pyrophosphatase family protein [Candida albicans]
MSGSLNSRWVVQVSLTIINIIGFLVFLRGFFPSKVVLPGFNSFQDSTKSPFSDQYGNPQFNKFILMVVDAMRSDFCFSDRSNFLRDLNVADDQDDSQGLHNQDSWVHQFRHSNNKTINFFGDDTWLKLFQDQFTEFEGTNSFFVSDFTEVDNNVTRHLDDQLSSNKWDGLILHYLGLDHIGHKGGPESPYMKPKQIEMDKILQRLYTYVTKNDDTLIVLMGDHGMNEIGNHGGSSPGETSAALSFISPKFNHKGESPLPYNSDYSYHHKISQIDLVPTLAALLNFPIPKNSLGVIAKEILEIWPENQRIKYY